MNQHPAPPTARRTFFARFNAGAAAVAAMALGGGAFARAKPHAPAKWEPARHDQDNWLDELAGKHRLAFDTVSSESLGDALLFATNFIVANRSDYGLQSSELAIVTILRHRSTPFGYNDAMWAKYAAQIASLSGTDAAAKANPRNTGGISLNSLSKQGAKYAVCSMATRRVAGAIAQATGGSVDAINSELTSNLIPGARMVSAGIVAVNRAQERGYSLVAA